VVKVMLRGNARRAATPGADRAAARTVLVVATVAVAVFSPFAEGATGFVHSCR
jgi:hypothetical protein